MLNIAKENGVQLPILNKTVAEQLAAWVMTFFSIFKRTIRTINIEDNFQVICI